MLTWYLGAQTHFAANLGAHGSHFERSLELAGWACLERTYADSREASAWDALQAMGTLFHTAATATARHFAFNHQEEDDQRMTAFVEQVRFQPRNSKRG
jgi:hypothetical protein